MARTAKKKISVYDEGILLIDDIDSLDFEGAGVSTTNVGPAVTATVSGGSSSSSLYTETPQGAIDGVNTVYTLTKNITDIYDFIIGDVSIHPFLDHDQLFPVYTISGNQITFTTPIDASLATSPFTIRYTGTPIIGGSFYLLEDGVSFYLMEDGVSKYLLE